MRRLHIYIFCFILSVVPGQYSARAFDDIRTEALNTVRLYYRYLQSYAADPSQVWLNENIKGLFCDGKGSVYNDVYSIAYGNADTDSDIMNYLTAVGAYKNKSGGFPLELIVDEGSFRCEVAGSSVYVYVSKKVVCRYGSIPVDYCVPEAVLVQNGKIVCIFRKAAPSDPVTVPVRTENVRKTGYVSDVAVWTDGVELMVDVSFVINGMKGRKGTVICYFYDDAHRALRDMNSSYATFSGCVASATDICPSYDSSRYEDLRIKIPVSELHLRGRYPRKLGLEVVLWDVSMQPADDVFKSFYVEFTYKPK